MISNEIIMTIATIDAAMNLYPVTTDHCLVYFFSDKIQLTKLDIAFITDFALITPATANWKIAPVFAPVTVVTLNIPISDVKKMAANAETYFTEKSDFFFLPNLHSNKKLEAFSELFLNQKFIPVLRLRKLKEELLAELQKALRNRSEHQQTSDDLAIDSEQIFSNASLANHNKEPQVDLERDSQSSTIPLPNRNLIELVYEKYFTGSFQHLPPNVSEIAAEMNISVQSFQHLFKLYYGKTFYRAYMKKKMEYAVMLLENGLRGTEVAELLGYSAPIKFNKQFQKYFSVTPYQYTKNRFKNYYHQAI
jgi:AraC-like DNA-binding protein